MFIEFLVLAYKFCFLLLLLLFLKLQQEGSLAAACGI